MKIKLFRKILLAITFASTIATVTAVVFKVVQKNNVEVTSKTNSKSYRPVEIYKDDFNKLLDYKNSEYVFNLPKTEYYLVHKTLGLYPELASKKFSFATDNYQSPKQLHLSVSGVNELKWFYSII